MRFLFGLLGKSVQEVNIHVLKHEYVLKMLHAEKSSDPLFI